MRGVAAHHQEQTASFLRFAAYKREQHVGEIDAAFEETVDTRCAPAASLSLGAGARLTTFVMRLRRLLAEEYSESDVREILDSLASVLKADLGKELENASHTNVLVLNQLFKQAEGMGLSFSVDTSQLEDHSLISEMKRFEDDAEERRAAEAKMTVRDRPGLATLAKASDGAGHLDLVRRNNELEDEVRQWKARFESLVRPPLPLLLPEVLGLLSRGRGRVRRRSSSRSGWRRRTRRWARSARRCRRNSRPCRWSSSRRCWRCSASRRSWARRRPALAPP